MPFQERDNIIGKIYRRLMEIESRLLPCGLHTVGVPPTAAEAVATLVNIASLDRPEDGIKSLPRIAAESMGREIGEIYTNADNGLLEDVELLQQVRDSETRFWVGIGLGLAQGFRVRQASGGLCPGMVWRDGGRDLVWRDGGRDLKEKRTSTDERKLHQRGPLRSR